MVHEFEVEIAGISLLESTNKNCIDLGTDVARDLLARKNVKPEEIAVLICVTLSAVYLMPSSSFLIHKNLGLSQECFQYDCYQGGDGFLGGIQLASSLLKGFDTDRRALIVFGDDELCVNEDEIKSVAVAMLLECSSREKIVIQNAVYSEECAKYVQEERKAKRTISDQYVETAKKNLNKQLQTMREYIIENQICVESQITYGQVEDNSPLFLQDSAVWLPYILLKKRMSGNILLGAVGSGMTVNIGIGQFATVEDFT